MTRHSPEELFSGYEIGRVAPPFPILVLWIPLSPVLVHDSALHYEHHSAYGGNVPERIAIEGDDVRLHAGTE